MGRRGVSVDQPERWIFNRLAAAYRGRPGYPPELVARLVALAAGGPVADLGAGTGQLAIPLAAAGLEVAAVEPARAMLAVLEELAGRAGVGVGALHASAEQTEAPAGHFGLVLLADVLQWVDPELAGREAARLLRPGGVLAVIEPAVRPTAFHADLEALFAQANPKARRRSSRGLGQLLALATGGQTVHVERFSQAVLLDDTRLAQTVRSLSFLGPALPEEALEKLVSAAVHVARVHGGAWWSRDITLTWSARGGSSA